MKISRNQTNPNLDGIINQRAYGQVQAPKQEKSSEGIKDVAYKQKSEPSLDEGQWIEVLQKANKAIEDATCSFKFSIHEQTKQIMVKVINKETKEVIREFPPEKILDMIAKMWEVAGIMVDERR